MYIHTVVLSIFMLNLLEILNSQKKQNFTEESFDIILAQCHEKIMRMSKNGSLYCYFTPPRILHGRPIYKYKDLLLYLIRKLSENGLNVFYDKNSDSLVISWKITEIDVQRYKGNAQKYGIKIKKEESKELQNLNPMNQNMNPYKSINYPVDLHIYNPKPKPTPKSTPKPKPKPKPKGKRTSKKQNNNNNIQNITEPMNSQQYLGIPCAPNASTVYNNNYSDRYEDNRYSDRYEDNKYSDRYADKYEDNKYSDRYAENSEDKNEKSKKIEIRSSKSKKNQQKENKYMDNMINGYDEGDMIPINYELKKLFEDSDSDSN